MDRKYFDVIVTGIRSMGVAACWYPAKQKYSVLGLEQFRYSARSEIVVSAPHYIKPGVETPGMLVTTAKERS